MRRATVVLVVSVVVVGTWLAVRALDTPPELPAVNAPSPTAATPTPALPVTPSVMVPAPMPVAQPEVVAALSDAGAPAEVREVRVRVVRGDVAEAGGRITLALDKDVVSGNVNQMGEVTLPLRAGTWDVLTPDDAATKTLEIFPDSTLVILRLAAWEQVSGEVRDEAGQLAMGAEVVDLETGATLAETDVEGHFAGRVLAARARLQARKGDARSDIVEVGLPAQHVKLQLSKRVDVRVIIVSAAGRQHIVMRHRQGLEDCHPEPFCRFSVPAGEFNVLAVGDVLGRTAIAQVTEVAKDEPLTLKLKLSPAPPLTGVVRDEKGAPVIGVSVRAHGLGRTSTELLRPTRRPSVVEDVVRKTDLEGRFSLQPVRSPDVFFSLALDGPWQLKHPALVALGDAPLELTALPGELDAGR